jgi:hypothetical protein
MRSLFNILYFLICFSNFSVASETEYSSSLSFSTIFGPLVVSDPLAVDLINSPGMQRLQGINQYGINEFVSPSREPYTRFEHCLGVYHILQMYEAPRLERIAGLLHDASHTAFSHAVDPLFMGNFISGAYQDAIHPQYLNQHFGQIFNEYSITTESVLPDLEQFQRLEQPLPDLCADRIEYNLHAGYLEGYLNQEKIRKILADLKYEKTKWFFITQESAEDFSRISLDQTLRNWGSSQNILVGNWTSTALKIMLGQKGVTYDEIEFNLSDQQLWDKMKDFNDPTVKDLVAKIQNASAQYEVVSDEAATEFLKSKFRGVNPWVQVDGDLKRLTDVSSSYREAYEAAQNRIQVGWPVQYS